MKRNKIILLLAIVAGIAAIGFKLADNKKTLNRRTENAIKAQQFDVVPVKTATVRKHEIDGNLSESGTFAAQQELKLSAQSQGQVTRLLVKKTQLVRKGQLLAVIDNSSLSSQLETARASLDKAKTDAQRMENALASGGVSQQQVENVRLQVQNAQTQIAQLQQQGRNYQVIAPMAGIVNDIFVEQGSFVSPGNPLLEIVDLAKVNLTVRLDQKDLTAIRLGQKVNVTTDVYPEKIFIGKVEGVNVKTDLSQKIEVAVSVPNTRKTPLLVGMYGHAEFFSDKKRATETALLIPRAAITGSIQDAKIWVVNPSDSTATRKMVTIGRTFDNEVEVVRGLTIGEQVVTAGQINLEDGKKVVVKN